MKRVLRRFLSLVTRRDDVELYVIEEVILVLRSTGDPTALAVDVRALVRAEVTTRGIVVGLLAAFALSPSALFYGVTTRDAISVLVVPLVIVLVSIAACAVPAWRAAHQSD